MLQVEIPVIEVDRDNAGQVMSTALAMLPTEMAARVDIKKSLVTPEGHLTFRDAKGELVWRHAALGPNPEAPVVQRSAPSPAPATGATNLTKAFEAITQLAEITTARLEQIEDRLDAMRKSMVERRGLAFKGEFQRALAYAEGDVVTRGDRLYVAAKDIAAGGNLRDGMEGWILMIKGVQQ